MKAPSPLLGYNNNVRHKNKIFHIQTEDSGVKYGHIITHLFADGGRILKSIKTSYAEHLGHARMADIVKEMMKEQHKAMFMALRDGNFDPLLEGSADVSQGTKAISADVAKELVDPVPARRTTKSFEAVLPVPLPVEPPIEAFPPSEATKKEIEKPPELTLDISALARAAAAAESAPFRPPSDLPPPPENLFREKTASGKYRSVPPAPEQVDVPKSLRRPALGEKRYAPTRPVSILGRTPEPPKNRTIFGEELLSDKSLDEVILSYLSDDLGAEKK